jgi:DNA-binding beta-propeller fold protein YncE
MKRAAAIITVAVLMVGGALAATPADAYRPLLSDAFLRTDLKPPPPEGELEDPCGVAIAPNGEIYVSDYYHRTVDVFSAAGLYYSQIALPGGPITGIGSNELDGVCGLAFDPGGNLYANEWHEGVVGLLPFEFRLDSGESTGVAVDAAGDVYVDDRTYVARYAAPVEPGDTPVAKIGLGTLGEGYGLAVSADGSRVYVADALADTVKVYEPAVSLTTPQATLSAGFTSLVDSALAIDPTLEPALPEHLLVLDNLQPGYEHPEAAVLEFEAPGAGHPASYAFVGQVKGPTGSPIVHGQPSGLAVDSAGDLFVTSGNSELGNVFKFGPDPPGGGEASAQAPFSYAAAGTAAATSGTAQGGGEPAASRAPDRRRKRRRAQASEVIQRNGVRVSVAAAVTPRRLPRQGDAPIRFSLDADIVSVEDSVPPRLRKISVEINRHGHLDPTGLPTCSFDAIQPATTAGALSACRPALVGEGRFNAKVLIAQQAPFPSAGKIVAFNGRWHGRPAILAHVYGTAPVPTSFTLPFVIGSVRHGNYGTVLSASLPRFTSKWGYVTGLSLHLGRSFRFHGAWHSYLTAGCPAPAGFSQVTFPLAHAILGFDGLKPISQTLIRSCTVR